MNDKYTPPYTIILTLVLFINIFFSAHFIAFLLVGVIFKIIIDALKYEYYYILFYTIFVMLIVEVVQGLHIFSLLIISLVLYYFVIPKIKHLFTSYFISQIIFVAIFYISVYIVEQIYLPFDIELLKTLVINFFIDSVIVGLIL